MNNRAYALLYRNHIRKTRILSTVSGIVTTEPETVGLFERTVCCADIITTKSYQVVATQGHREPVVCSLNEGDFGNFVGLRNPGADAVYSQLKTIYENGMRAILNISLSANTPENFIVLVNMFSPICDMVELNFSCPHASAGFGASIGSSAEIASYYVSEIVKARTDKHALLIVKLTPNVEDIGKIAKAVINAGADGVAAINTVGPLSYVEKNSGMSIFNLNEGGKGGASGKWVHEKALECIGKIRNAIGDEPIVLGMGGVCVSEDVDAMLDAGADCVGVGSVLSRIEPENWSLYFKALKNGFDAGAYIVPGNRLTYNPHKVISAEKVSEDTLILTLEGKLDCKPGQFAFLWIPQKGEKPFSVACNTPLTFLIKKRGFFTSECFNLKKGDTVYLRGLYGKPMNLIPSRHALLIAGGSGVAVLPLIAERLKPYGTEISIKVGIVKSSGNSEPLQNLLNRYGKTEYIADDGKPGRVIDTIFSDDITSDTRVYVVGPGKMMEKCSNRLRELGMSPDRINMSMEKLTLCGVGMCGECVCAGRLPCKTGTFYTAEELESHGVAL